VIESDQRQISEVFRGVQLASALAGNGDAGPLASMNEKFPTGALAVFDADLEAWKDLRPGCARLERFVRPRDLVAV